MFAPLYAVALACGPVVSTDSGGDAGGDEESTRGSATTEDPTVESASDPTTGTTAIPGDATGTPPMCADAWAIGCQSYCAAVVTCDPENGPFEECVNECTTELLKDPGECQVAWCEAYSCIGLLDCPTIDAGDATCDALWAEADECSPDVACLASSGPGTCELRCFDPDRRISCDAARCDCFEGEVQIASCEFTGACDEPAGLDIAAGECCAWW